MLIKPEARSRSARHGEPRHVTWEKKPTIQTIVTIMRRRPEAIKIISIIRLSRISKNKRARPKSGDCGR